MTKIDQLIEREKAWQECANLPSVENQTKLKKFNTMQNTQQTPKQTVELVG